ncbi:hypothetical protein P7K49_002508, partial [Saguinus oedipus]
DGGLPLGPLASREHYNLNELTFSGKLLSTLSSTAHAALPVGEPQHTAQATELRVLSH